MASGDPEDVKPMVLNTKEPITIIVRAQNNSELAFKVKAGAVFSKVANAYCKTKGINPGSVRFHTDDGGRIACDKTIAELDLDPEQDDDGLKVYIDAYLQQVGGGGVSTGCWSSGDTQFC